MLVSLGAGGDAEGQAPSSGRAAGATWRCCCRRRWVPGVPTQPFCFPKCGDFRNNPNSPHKQRTTCSKNPEGKELAGEQNKQVPRGKLGVKPCGSKMCPCGHSSALLFCYSSLLHRDSGQVLQIHSELQKITHPLGVLIFL